MQEQADLISVVIPCFNDGQYLPETIAKTKKQSYKNIEILVVNDGSTDKHTLEVLKQLANDTQVTVLHKENGKMSSARNHGVKHSKGEYIVTLDSDDFFDAGFFVKAKSILDADKNIVAVSSYVKNFGLNENKFKPRGGNTSNFLFSSQCPACAMLKKADWDLVNGYDEAMTLGHEDWDFYLRLTYTTNRRVFIIPEYLFFYRQTKKSTLKNITEPNAATTIDYMVSKNAEIYLSSLKTLIEAKEVLYIDSRVSWQNIIAMIKGRVTAKYK